MAKGAQFLDPFSSLGEGVPELRPGQDGGGGRGTALG